MSPSLGRILFRFDKVKRNGNSVFESILGQLLLSMKPNITWYPFIDIIENYVKCNAKCILKIVIGELIYMFKLHNVMPLCHADLINCLPLLIM